MGRSQQLHLGLKFFELTKHCLRTIGHGFPNNVDVEAVSSRWVMWCAISVAKVVSFGAAAVAACSSMHWCGVSFLLRLKIPLSWVLEVMKVHFTMAQKTSVQDLGRPLVVVHLFF